MPGRSCEVKTDGFAFNDDGTPAVVVPFSYPDEGATYAEALEQSSRAAQAEAVGRVIDLLLSCGASRAGRNVLVLGYLLHRPEAARSQRQLACQLHLSVGRVNALCRQMRGQLLSR